MSSMTAAAHVGAPARLGPAMAALMALGVLLPCLGLPGRWLWLDELLSVNFAAHGPWATLITVLRFDVHPPLYYLQLSLWMLAGQGDAWLMANSIFWHVAAIGLLTFGAARLHGMRVGLAAGLLLALSPAALAYADQVRMYAFLIFLIVWVWYAQARWLEGTGGRLGALWMVLSQVAVTSSHTAGLLMLSGCVVLGAATVLRDGRRALILRWLLIEAAVALLSLPSVVIGMVRGVTHLRAPGIEDVLGTWGFLSGSGGSALGPVAVVLGLAVLAGLVLGCLRDRRLILPVLTLIVLPMLLAAAMSHLARPLWIERIFVTVIPFICLCLARTALEGVAVGPRTGGAAVLALAAVWGAVGISAQLVQPKTVDGFRPAALAVQEKARSGDVVLVDSDFSYWCFMWYFAGPQWGQPRHAFILSPEWERLMRRLDSSLPSVLGLNDSDTRREVGGVTVVLWDRRQPPPVGNGDVFLLRGPQAEPAALPGLRLGESTRLVQLTLERWVPVP